MSSIRRWVLTQLSYDPSPNSVRKSGYLSLQWARIVYTARCLWLVLSFRQHKLKLNSTKQNQTKLPLTCYSISVGPFKYHVVRIKSEKLSSSQQTNLPCVLCACRIDNKTWIGAGHNTKRCFKGFALADTRFGIKTDRFANEVWQDSHEYGLQEILQGGSKGSGIFGWSKNVES